MSEAPEFIVVAGPTASGKSALALALAEQIGGEIIGCDSVQLYRQFNIGSAKPSAEELRRVPHHLIDVVDWHEDYDAAKYAREARLVVAQIKSRKKVPIVVGGTGLYLRALLQEAFHQDLPSDDQLRAELQTYDSAALYQRLHACDPERAGQIHPNDRFRVIRALELNTLLGGPVHLKTKQAANEPGPASSALVFILNPERAALHARIALRTKQMLADGLLEEVSNLIHAGVSLKCKPMESIGYKQAGAYLSGQLAKEDLFDHIAAATRQYAKRQCTWFRKVNGGIFLPPDASGDGLLNLVGGHPLVTPFRPSGC
jgi:tRNA dimethylallyltransferase